MYRKSGTQGPGQNLRRYFAVQYTRSCVSLHCTISAILAQSRTVSPNQNGVLMSDDVKPGLKSPLRPNLLMGMAALPAISMPPRPSFAHVPATPPLNTTRLPPTAPQVTLG